MRATSGLSGVDSMDAKTHEMLVRQIGEAFKALPDDWHRIDVLASLCGLMENRVKQSQDNHAYGWMIQATGCLKGVRLMWKRKEKDNASQS